MDRFLTDLGDFRVTFVSALAWRAMTEIVRRRHIAFDFVPLQVHPGVSPRGLIELRLRPRGGGRELRVDFHLGGPQPGSWHVPGGNHGSLLDLLREEPAAAIDAIERAAGLPAWPGHRLTPSTPGVRAMRRLAAELEHRVFEPRQWRTTAAFIGWQEDIVCDWHRYFVAPVRSNAHGAVRPEERERLSRLVMLHEAPGGNWVTSREELRGEALVVDLSTGRAARMTRSGIVPLKP